MASTGSKWLIGCGIGCGVVLLIIIIIGAVGYLFIKDTVDTFKEAESSHAAMEELYGSVEDYRPDPKGIIPAERIETFLAIRDTLSVLRLDWEDGLKDFSRNIEDIENSKKSFWKVLDLIRKGVGVIPEMAAFYTARNEALINADMGEGEYTYLYVLIFYSYLGKSPGDGPEFSLMGDDNNNRGFQFDDEWDKQEYVDETREKRLYRITQKARRLVRPMMRCQLDELKEQGTRGSWRNALEAELDALDEDRDRLPWQKGLPQVMNRTLRSYRSQLEESYSPLMNPMEVGPNMEW